MTIEKETTNLLRVSEQVDNFANKLNASIERKLQDKNREIFLYVTKMKGAINKQVRYLHQRINRFKSQFDNYENRLALYRQRISMYVVGLKKDVDSSIESYKNKLGNLEKLVTVLDYQKTLKRGFEAVPLTVLRIFKAIFFLLCFLSSAIFSLF